jgi:DNA polymerase-3 subunit gamma/tau
LLKTLEEPPPHVVYVLATTDPQKVSETIRSRTQHLQFRLLPMRDLAEHVRFVVADAGLEVTDAAIEQVLVQGGGSARDTLSALELVVAAGGVAQESVDLDEFIEAIIDGDPARALAAVAFAVQQGCDPRTLGDQLVRQLREAFLTQMAPELVQLPVERAEHVAAWAQRMGNGSIVRSMEVIGDTLVEMRHAPDGRLLLEVSLMKLCSPGDLGDVSGLVARIERLERAVATGVTAAPAAPPPPVDPTTGRAKLGGAARPAGDTPRAAPEPKLVKPTAPKAPEEKLSEDAAPVPTSPSFVANAAGIPAELWPQVLTSLRPLVRALYSACSVSSPTPDTVVLSAPNAVHQAKCNEYAATVAAAFEKLSGRKVGLNVDVGGAPKDRSAAAPRAPRRNVASDEIPHDDGDPTGVSDMPVDSALDRINRSFPGSKVIDEGGAR